MTDTTTAREQLASADMDRHKRMLKRLTEAQELQVQINALAGRQAELVGAWKIWVEELHERYDLATDGSEGVDGDGTVQRANSLRPSGM